MSILTQLPQKTSSPSAIPANVVAGGSAWTFGSYVQLIASTANPITVTGIVFDNLAGLGITFFEIQLAIGAAGSEVAVSSWIYLFEGPSIGPCVFPFRVPFDGITTATRVAIRIRSQFASVSLAADILYYERFDSDHKSTLAQTYVPNGAVGVSLTPSGVAWTNTAWVTLTTGLSSENAITDVVGFMESNAGAPHAFELDLATGAAGSEVLLTTLRGGNTSDSGLDYLSLPVPMAAPASTRIAIRQRQSTTANGNTWQLSLQFLGPTSLLPPPPPGGGGSPGTGIDPPAGVSLCGITAPLTVWAELELNSGFARYSRVNQPLNHPGTYQGGPKQPRLLSLTPITRSLSDYTGHFVTAGPSIVLEDTDGVIRALEQANTLKNKQLNVFAIDDTSARSAGVPYRAGSFLVKDYVFLGDRSFKLTLIDRVGANTAGINLTKQLPPVLLDTTSFPTLPSNLIGKAAPIPYGLLSDDSAPPNSGTVGVVPVWYVGTRVLADGNTWYEGLIAGCPIKAVLDVFGSGGPPVSGLNPTRIKLDTSHYTTDLAVPGLGQWNTVTGGTTTYRVFNNRRWTVMYAKRGSVVGEAFANGTVPLVVNIAGIEDVGDGTGTMITSLPRQLVHLLNNFILQSPPGDANWLTIPQIGTPAYSIISTSTFETVKTTSEARIAGGYVGAFVVGWDLNQLQASDWVSRICLGGDFDLFLNRHGQVCASMEDKTLPTTKSFVDITQVGKGSFTQPRDFSKWANRLIWDHMKHLPPPAYPSAISAVFAYDTTVWLFAKDLNNDATLETSQREIQIFQYEDWVMRDFTLALPNNVAQHKLARMKHGPMFPVATVDLCGCDLELGNTYNLTHFAAPTATARLCRVYAMAVDLLAGKVMLTGFDMSEI